MNALRFIPLIVVCLVATSCSQGRSPEQAFDELRAAIESDDFEAVVRLLPERVRSQRLADLEEKISEWRDDPEALARVGRQMDMTPEEILGKPRLWVLSRMVRASIPATLRGLFLHSRVVGVEYQADDEAEVHVEVSVVDPETKEQVTLPGTTPHKFVREGAKWCWLWDGVVVLGPPIAFRR